GETISAVFLAAAGGQQHPTTRYHPCTFKRLQISPAPDNRSFSIPLVNIPQISRLLLPKSSSGSLGPRSRPGYPWRGRRRWRGRTSSTGAAAT
uniref:Uncharacterized protein n=1 Tax=Aegilops tauschii subsp. strangulata TaxID=200361 RepID=A0A453CQI2_AEGTS